MLEPTIAARADYADAILVARRAKNWLFLVLLIVLVGQIAIFFTARYTSMLTPDATTMVPSAAAEKGVKVLKYLVAMAGFIGLTASLVLSCVMMLLVKIMLTGRTLGVAKVTSAFIWTLLLIVLLFPWQAMLSNPTLSATPDAMVVDFKIPGVLYTWTEVTHPTLGAKFDSTTLPTPHKVLRWARFVGFPVLAVLILMSIQIKSSRGIKSALGEDVAPTTDAVNT